MATAVAEWWTGLSDMWKGVLVLVAVGSAAVSLTIGLIEYKNLPHRVLINERNIAELQSQGAERARNIEDAVQMLERILCYMEAETNEQSAVGCAR